MSYREYKKGEHGAGFIGIRIALWSEGKFKQEYFSFVDKNRAERKILRAQADALYAKWKEAQNAHKRRQRIGASYRQNCANSTLGAVGLTANFAMKTKNGVKYAHPVIIVRGAGQKEKRFSVSTFGGKKAFEAALDEYQVRHSLSDRQKKEIRKAADLVGAFKFIRKRALKNGYDLPVARMKEWGIWS